jgi:phosphoribosylformylglycinamidine synthase
LLKLGLLPYGRYSEMNVHSPAIALNPSGRHRSAIVRTRVSSNKSPWLSKCEVGDIHAVVLSCDEGRFAASPDEIRGLAENGQICAQYVDLNGEPTMSPRFNPCGSADAVESVASPDGRILGKMGHCDRSGQDLLKNVPGNYEQGIFESGVGYYI